MSRTRTDAIDSRTGWLIVGMGVCLLVLLWGMLFTFTVYSDHLAAAFDLSSFRLSSVFSIATASFFIVGGVVGIFIARIPLRPVVATISAVLGLALSTFQVVGSYPGLVAVFALIGATSGTTFIVVISLVPQWFDAYEGRAMGITSTGSGLGILLLPFAWLWLLDRTGIRTAFAVVGGATVVLLLVASLVYRRPPGRRQHEASSISLGWLRSKLSDVRFQSATVGFALLWGWYFVLSADLVEILTTAGIGRTVAVTAFGTIGGISIATRVGSGTIADWIGMRVTLTTGVTLTAVGLLLLIAGRHSLPLVYLTLFIFGIGLGTIGTLFPPIAIGQFGPENASAIVGLFFIAEASTAFLAPLLVNALVGITGGYALPLLAMAVITMVGASLFYWGTDPSARRAPA